MRLKSRILAALRALCICVVLSMCWCGKSALREEPESITFALTANTHPESPFSTVSPRVAFAFDAIRAENPVFTVHLGSITFGGRDWMGIRESDIVRQYAEFYRMVPRLGTILYTARGDLDMQNGSAELYTRHTKKNRYYSFNYGAAHFIILDSTDPDPGVFSDAQINWLASDLDLHGQASAIFVFSHHPLMAPKNGRYYNAEDICKNSGRITGLFAKGPVKAVFSGHLNAFSIDKKDDIQHVSAGCGGFNKNEMYTRTSQYYIVRYTEGVLNVTEKRIN